MVETVEAEEGAAYGAALLAGVGGRAWASVDEACGAVVTVSSRLLPNTSDVELMGRQYERFRALYPALRTIAGDSQTPEDK
jgi:xylulokinase